MKTIKILGTGCDKCKLTEEIVRDVVAESNIEVEIEKVEDIMDIMSYNVLSTPAIVVDERIRIYGHVPSKAEVKAVLISSKQSS